MHFLCCLSILHAPSFSIPTSQMLAVGIAHSVVVSNSLHHTTLHSTQSISLASFLVLFPRVLPGKSFFCHCYPLLYFLRAVHVTTNITPQVLMFKNIITCQISYKLNNVAYSIISSESARARSESQKVVYVLTAAPSQ